MTSADGDADAEKDDESEAEKLGDMLCDSAEGEAEALPDWDRLGEKLCVLEGDALIDCEKDWLSELE